MYANDSPNRKHEIAKQIPAVQLGVRTCRKKLVFAKQIPRDTRGKTGSRRKNLFLQNKIDASTERYTVASPSPAHGLVAGRFLIHSSYASAQEILSDFAMYNFLGRTAGGCHDRRRIKVRETDTLAQKPQVLRGFRDLLPHRMRLTQRVIRTATDVFERFGFEPLATPALEYAETLAGKSGEETDTLFYRFLDRGQREIGLRYDLTVPLARVFAMHQDLGRPFKRYQIDKVWRAERPQRGRYREFYQCDADVVGSSSTLADAEVISIAHAALLELGFERFKIKINNRKLLVPLAERCQVPGHLHGALFRSVDKLEKIGPSGVEKELEAAGVPTSSTDRIFEMISRAALEEDKFAYAERELATTDQGRQGVTELREIWQHLLDSGVDEGRIALDLSLVRGMDYYTGPIFEAVDLEDGIGSIGAGGRYDRLIGAFSGQDAPAVGVSLGLERDRRPHGDED